MSDIPELLERFRRAPEVIAMMLTGVFGEEVDFKPAPDKWNIRTLTRHLADTELLFSTRFRRMIAEDNPALEGFDQNAWVEKLDYAQRKPAQSLELFRKARADNYELLAAMPPEVFDRKGTSRTRGEFTLRQMVERSTSHVESHARQMQAVREAYKLAKAKK